MTEPNNRDAENVCTTGLKSPPSRTTVYRQTKAMRKTLPTSPKRFANVITTLNDNASPMKQAAIAKRGIKRKIDEEFLLPPLKKTILELKTNMNEVKRRQYNIIASAAMRAAHSGIKSKLASALGIGHRTHRKLTKNAHNPILSRKKRKDVIDKSTIEKVQDHWTSEGISHVVPLKKRVKKGQPFRVLDCSYMQAYRRFKVTHPNIKIGYVSFIKHKPIYVRHMKTLERSVCCICEFYQNVKNMSSPEESMRNIYGHLF